MEAKLQVQDLPTVITNALKQLLLLKTSLREASTLRGAIKKINVTVNDDVYDFATKVRCLLKNVKNTVDTIDATFCESFKNLTQTTVVSSINSAIESNSNNTSDTNTSENVNKKKYTESHTSTKLNSILTPTIDEDSNTSAGSVVADKCNENISLVADSTDSKSSKIKQKINRKNRKVNKKFSNADKHCSDTDIDAEASTESKNAPDTEQSNDTLELLVDSTAKTNTHSQDLSSVVECDSNEKERVEQDESVPKENLTRSKDEKSVLQCDRNENKEVEQENSVSKESFSGSVLANNQDTDTLQDEGECEKKTEILDVDKPKIGLIKCIDITKLLDPKVTDTNKDLMTCKNDTPVILLSSDSENEITKRSTRSVRNRAKTKVARNQIKTESKKESKIETKNKSKAESISSEDEPLTRLSSKRTIQRSSKKAFERLRDLRQKIHKKLPSETNSSSDSSNDSSSSEPKPIKNKTRKHQPITDLTSSAQYDYKNDAKFSYRCVVSLPRVPVEQLKQFYRMQKEDQEIDRLLNMKTLKRTRQQTSASSSETERKGTTKKRNKIVRRASSSDGEHSESDQEQQDDIVVEPITASADIDPPVPADLLSSGSGNSDKNNQSSDEEKQQLKKDTKKTDKKKEVKAESKKEKGTNSSSEDEGKKVDNKKGKWRNSKLLRGKLNETDSEEELLRFRSKKNQIDNDIHSGTEDEVLIKKKSKTKKTLKRIARRLDSDASADSDDSSDAKSKSSSEAFKSKEEKKKNSSSSSSDSDKDDEENKKKPRRRIKRIKDSDDSSEGERNSKKTTAKDKDEEDLNTRKKIRHVWNRESLAETTKRAAKEEEERKKRISERQKMYNDIYVKSNDENAKVDKVVLDFNEETKEELLSVHPDLVSKLKPHQAKGVQFMWTACFESLERATNTAGSGCILAHCMGLGKTLQVITLIHTLLTNTEKTGVRTVLVVCPLSTVLNWVAEFKKWLDDLDGEQVNVFDLVSYKQNFERLYQMQDWVKNGGVLIMGYDMFRNLSSPKGKRMSKKLVNGFGKCLLEPGPDMVVCDEGHLLKNEKTGISIAMNRLRTLRRIVLTGTPLQNNLKEYFCMVQFVKPNLLGTYKEYLNRFVNPITNGQYTDSTDHDIQIMRKRAHVLHKMLDAVVERRDYCVLAPYLPPKHEYVLFVSLTAVQTELYREYLARFARNTATKGTSYLFQDFQELQRICIHPRVLLDKSNQDKQKDLDDDSEGSLKDFIDDDESEKSTSANDNSSDSDSNNSAKENPKRRTRANPGDETLDMLEEPENSRDEWWARFCQGDELDNIAHSSKLTLLFDILHQCELIGDKVLVFSQSLFSLNLIEYFLARVDEATQNNDAVALAQLGGHGGSWALGLDYFRMDGSTSCDNRATWCKTFNNETNTRARLFLISTRAGGLGINLVAANRVIIFDVSWNPSYDIQSIYRVYRFGQTKPCYVYRFVTLGTMENKIYERQVTKQAISKRVIDEQQIDRHYNQNDLAELYVFQPVPDEERPTPLVPKDRLFADLLQAHEEQIFKYHEHNSLLENKADEGLNEEERLAAWEEFENEKKAPKFNLMQTMVRNGMYETLRTLVQQDNSAWTPAQVNSLLPSIVQRISEQVARGDYTMYRCVEEKHEARVMEQRRMQMVYQQYMQQLRGTNTGNSMTPADINKLALMMNAYNQAMTQMQAQQPTSATPAVSFALGDPPQMMGQMPASAALDQAANPVARAPVPHPNISEVVELND